MVIKGVTSASPTHHPVPELAENGEAGPAPWFPLPSGTDDFPSWQACCLGGHRAALGDVVLGSLRTDLTFLKAKFQRQGYDAFLKSNISPHLHLPQHEKV